MRFTSCSENLLSLLKSKCLFPLTTGDKGIRMLMRPEKRKTKQTTIFSKKPHMLLHFFLAESLYVKISFA